MGRNHTQEHGERIDGGVGHGGRIAAGAVTCIRKGRWIGVAAGEQTHDGEEVDFVNTTSNASHNYQGNECDQEAPYNPHHTGVVENCFSKSCAGANADGCKEQAYAKFSHEQRCRGGCVGYELEFIAETAEKNCHNERSTGQTELHAHAEVDGADYDTEHDAHENCDEVGLVEAFHRVAEFVGETRNIVNVTNNGDAVAHLETQVGRCKKIHASAVNASGIELIGGM